MLIYDDIYSWEGWGGKLKLGSGKCRLRIFDLRKDQSIKGISFIKPIIAVLTDIPDSKMTVRSCTSHIATCVSYDFNIDHTRMLWIEYYPKTIYGSQGDRVIPERVDSVEFIWQENKAIKPAWRTLQSPMADIIRQLIIQSDSDKDLPPSELQS
jgi:hypothetical protein